MIPLRESGQGQRLYGSIFITPVGKEIPGLTGLNDLGHDITRYLAGNLQGVVIFDILP